MDGKLFDEEEEAPKTPVKTKFEAPIRLLQAPQKVQLEGRFADVEPVDFDLTKKLFPDTWEKTECYDHLLTDDEESEPESNERYSIFNAPKKARRQVNYDIEIGELNFDMTKQLFPATEAEPMCFDGLFSDDEESSVFEPSFMNSKTNHYMTCGSVQKAPSTKASGLTAPAILNSCPVKPSYKMLMKEKSYDGSISSARRLSMLTKKTMV